MGYDWQTPGYKGAAIRTVQHLDRDGDGALSEKEVPGIQALDRGGKMGVEAEELQAWMETDAVDGAREVGRSAWAFLDGPNQLEEAVTDVEGWKKATIATGVIGGALLLLALILFLTGFGAPAGIACFLGAMSAIACPIAGAEFADANKKLDQVKAEIADHRELIVGQLQRAVEEAPPKPAAALPLPAASTGGVSLRPRA